MQKEVYRMLCIILVDKEAHPAITDLIFDNARPTAVLEWTDESGEKHPLVAVSLDITDLALFKSDEADYIYRRTIDNTTTH